MPEPKPLSDVLASIRSKYPELPPPLSPDEADEFRHALVINHARAELVGAFAKLARSAASYALRIGPDGPADLDAGGRLTLALDELFKLVTGSILSADERNRIGGR